LHKDIRAILFSVYTISSNPVTRKQECPGDLFQRVRTHTNETKDPGITAEVSRYFSDEN